jgi:filamentous hemagglutinin
MTQFLASLLTLLIFLSGPAIERNADFLRCSLAAKGADAAAALRSKLSALENAQQTAARTRTLPDGRVRYYGPETPARTPGPTRGASYVTEHNPATGQVRSWMESYDQAGNVTRVHPKMIDGQPVNLPHYPPTGKELGQ